MKITLIFSKKKKKSDYSFGNTTKNPLYFHFVLILKLHVFSHNRRPAGKSPPLPKLKLYTIYTCRKRNDATGQ